MTITDTEFAYDPLGRRMFKHSTPKLPIGAMAQAAANPAWLASETARLSRERGYGVTLYGWDGDQIAWEGDGETTTHYVFEPGSFVPLMLAKAKQRIALIPTPDWSERDYDIDADPLWTYSPEPQPFEQLYFYHTDHLGTPQELTDAEGNLAWSADYKAWGEAKAVISEAAKRAGISNPLRFQGQYFDHETGLHYNRHRYYDPSVGRFISKDPIGLEGGFNIFAYAANPIGWVDPLGLMPNFKKSEIKSDLEANRAKAGGDAYECEHCGFKNGNKVYAISEETNRPVGDGSFHADHYPISNANGGSHATGSRILGGTCNCSQGNGRAIKTTCMDKYPELHNTNDTVTLNKKERKNRSASAKKNRK